MFLRHVIAFSFIALLAGCAGFSARESVEGHGSPAQWAANKQQLTGLDGWQIDGKIGIRAPKDSGSGTPARSGKKNRQMLSRSRSRWWAT